MPNDDYTTLGRLAARTGIDYRLLKRAAAQVAPAFRLNGTPYFSPDQADELKRLASGAAPAVAG